jgi:hypothetical protein
MLRILPMTFWGIGKRFRFYIVVIARVEKKDGMFILSSLAIAGGRLGFTPFWLVRTYFKLSD